MIDVNPELKPPRPGKTEITRREFLRGLGAVIAAKALKPLPQEVKAKTLQYVEDEELIYSKGLVDYFVSRGKALQVLPIYKDGSELYPGIITNKDMLDSIRSGIDLALNENQLAELVRMMIKQERFLTIIGVLDVEGSLRYDQKNPKYAGEKPYFCNTYALDLLRFILGDNHIGSRYNIDNGDIFVAGINDPRPTNENEKYFDSNNLDIFMTQFGARYGWIQAKNEAELQQYLNQNYICLGVTKKEVVEEGQRQDVNFCGHAFTLGHVRSHYCISQATTHIPHLIIPYEQNRRDPSLRPEDIAKITPENAPYNFWVCKIPETNEY